MTKTPDKPICKYCGNTPRTTLKNHWVQCKLRPRAKPGRPTGIKKTGGRKAGVINKSSMTAKQAIQQVFEDLGGVKAMVNWATNNQTDFYTKVYPKLLPIDTTAKHNIENMPALTVNLTSKPVPEKKDDDEDENKDES